MGAFQNQLNHVAEPAKPIDRADTESATLHDYQALWFAEKLRDFAHYHDHDHEDGPEIAVAYASYIDKKVRDSGQSYIDLYAHTDVAVDVLISAVNYIHQAENGKSMPVNMMAEIIIELYELEDSNDQNE